MAAVLSASPLETRILEERLLSFSLRSWLWETSKSMITSTTNMDSHRHWGCCCLQNMSDDTGTSNWMILLDLGQKHLPQ